MIKISPNDVIHPSPTTKSPLASGRIDLALAEARRLPTLVDELLQYSSTPCLQLAKLDLNSLADSALTLFRGIETDRHPSIELTIASEPIWSACQNSLTTGGGLAPPIGSRCRSS